MSKPNVAFLGLGIMGSGMARRLLVNGFPLAVFNRSQEKSRSFAAEGARIAGSARDAAVGAQVVISMLADDRASRAVWMGDEGVLSAVSPGAVCIECSTVTPGWARELLAAVTARGCSFLDAPVTGSKAQAASGELNFLVGGAAETLAQAHSVLSAMSKTILLLGPVGSGALLKLINNFVCGVELAALAEAVTMIERAGLDREKALGIIANGAPGSPLVKAVSDRMTRRDYQPNFLLRLMAKDLGYAIQEGNNLALELTTAAAALTRFQSAIGAGNGEQDIAAVIEPLRANPAAA